MKTVGIIVTVFATAIPLTAWYAYVLTVIWGWFVVPLFGLPALDIWAAIGLSLVINYMWKTTPENNDENDDESMDRLIKVLGYCLVRPLIALGIGWIVFNAMN